MFKRKPETTNTPPAVVVPTERVTSVLGPGINWQGNLRGTGGIRIEGAFEGELTIKGMVVVGQTGRVTTQKLRANTVIIAGLVQGNIVAERLEIRSTGRVWGDVLTVTFATEEGAFLRGQVRMEETVDLQLDLEEAAADDESNATEEMWLEE
ncbi:MAG: polymer-forming cytoskeletal protein [Anaerolineaceae bacterium]|nr:polymer-forming cytoskeletal protein [Anaerolineaceae bacterium]